MQGATLGRNGMTVTLRNWKWESAKVGHGRTDDLRAVDQRVEQYRLSPTLPNLRLLAGAILDWRRSKGNWTTSIRVREMIALINLVKAESRLSFPAASGQIFSYLHCEGVLASLQSNPQTFLQSNVLVVSGSDNGPRQFRLEYRDDDGVFGNDDILQGAIPGRNSYGLATSNRGPHLDMESVAMATDVTPASNQAFAVAKFHPITQALLTTGQLTGCCFIMRRHAGAFECAHIQPLAANWPGGGVALQNFLENLGIVGATFYGKKDYGDCHVSVVGRMAPGGLWNVYAQRCILATKVILGFEQILING